MAKGKIKHMSEAQKAEKAARTELRAVNDTGAAIDLPEIQRNPRIMAIEPIGGANTAKSTLRRKTKVEMLANSKAIDAHHVQAIDLYVKAAEYAYAGCVKACSYGEGGGSSPTGAAAAAHGRMLDRVGDSDRYFRARAALPKPYVSAFERIVLDNHAIGAVGADMWPGFSPGYVSSSIRELVRTCADAIHVEFTAELGETESLRPHLMKTMVEFDRKVRGKTVSDTIRDSMTPSATTLIVAGAVADDLRRENEIAGNLVEFDGLAVEVRENWSHGWFLQGGVA